MVKAWAFLVVLFGAIALVIAFTIGGLAVVTPFIPGVKDWSKTLTLYDITSTFGFWYALLMCTIGILFYPVLGQSSSIAEKLRVPISLPAVIILVLLIVGLRISS